MKKVEIRNITAEIRQIEEGSRKITGLAIPVESVSELLYGEFYETISRDAVTEELISNNDIKLYVNHDESQGTFARSKYGEGSMRLFITDRGLEFETELPNTAWGDMLLEGIKRGDYDAVSFAFVPDGEEWQTNPDGTYNRTIKSISALQEISVLACQPAYEATEVNLRSLDEYKESENRKKESENKINLLLSELETIIN